MEKTVLYCDYCHAVLTGGFYSPRESFVLVRASRGIRIEVLVRDREDCSSWNVAARTHTDETMHFCDIWCMRLWLGDRLAVPSSGQETGDESVRESEVTADAS